MCFYITKIFPALVLRLSESSVGVLCDAPKHTGTCLQSCVFVVTPVATLCSEPRSQQHATTAT